MDYSFLKNLTLVDTGRIRTPKEKNPKGIAIRIFSNGEVYPSQELVDKYKLEYLSKNAEGTANGIDVVDSTEWTPMAAQPRMILFGITPKSEPKVDLFGSCKFNDDLTPKSTVMTQGSTSETLLNLVRSMGYLNDDQKYVDLVLLEQYPINTKDGLAFIPKTITRGPNAGQRAYERRENIIFYPTTTQEEFDKLNNPVRTESEVVQNEESTLTTSN